MDRHLREDVEKNIKKYFRFISCDTMRHIYILRCADDTFYTWMTTDLERRVVAHNTSPVGAKYTKSRRPVTLVWSQCNLSRNEAAVEEYRIKCLSRTQKMKMIEKS